MSRQVLITCDFCGTQQPPEGAAWTWRDLDACAGCMSGTRPLGEVLEQVRKVLDDAAGGAYVSVSDIIPARARPRARP